MACGVLALFFATVWGQGLPHEMDDSVAVIRSLSDDVKQCGPYLYETTKWGNKPNEIENAVLDSAINVIWDVVHATTVRAPYSAYIEFSTRFGITVPPQAKEAYDRRMTLPDFRLGTWKMRYEFDMGPDSVEFVRALYHQEGIAQWSDFVRRDSCWDRALRINIKVKHDSPESTLK